MATELGPAIQMKIAVWYHAMFVGGKSPQHPFLSQAPMEADWSISIMLDQMDTIRRCGLVDVAQELVICVNGGGINQAMARSCAPPKARFIDHGEQAQSMLLTTRSLREWCLTHKDWLVCFFHMKGVTRPKVELDHIWRKCMEHWTLTNWRRCVSDLQSGCDSVGAHWLTPEQYGSSAVPIPIWGGMFFWAKASFLAELPQLQSIPKTADDWWLPERWIGSGRRPRVMDYAPHWPGIASCGSSLATDIHEHV
jgi:hypothetical protein